MILCNMATDITLDEIKRTVGDVTYFAWFDKASVLYDNAMSRNKHGGLNGQGVQREPRTHFIATYIRANYSQHQNSQPGAQSSEDTGDLTDLVNQA